MILRIRRKVLPGKLSVFAIITEVLRQHYFVQSVKSVLMQGNVREAEPGGKKCIIQLGPLDLRSGYVALSEGGAIGLRENMLFSVYTAGEEISKIRIKKVFRTYSLAELIPLVKSSQTPIHKKKLIWLLFRIFPQHCWEERSPFM